MATVVYDVIGIQSQGNVSIKKSGDVTERCNTGIFGNCTKTNGTAQSSEFISGDLPKGVAHQIDVVISEGDCSHSVSQLVCCAATGGNVTGNLTPAGSTQQNYLINGIDGNYIEIGGNSGWSITGGNATFNTTTSGGSAIVNVGTQPFQLCYNFTSCGVYRNLCVDVVPQVVACSITVSNLSITC